jgi:ABC-2 type transport system ATP-binding protein
MQEVEAICERVIIIDHGIIMANEEKSRIYSLVNKSRQIIEVEFDKPVPANLLSTAGKAVTVTLISGNTWQIESEGEDDIRTAVFNLAVKNGLTVLSLTRKQSNLEEVFRHLTS